MLRRLAGMMDFLEATSQGSDNVAVDRLLQSQLVEHCKALRLTHSSTVWAIFGDRRKNVCHCNDTRAERYVTGSKRVAGSVNTFMM